MSWWGFLEFLRILKLILFKPNCITLISNFPECSSQRIATTIMLSNIHLQAMLPHIISVFLLNSRRQLSSSSVHSTSKYASHSVHFSIYSLIYTGVFTPQKPVNKISESQDNETFTCFQRGHHSRCWSHCLHVYVIVLADPYPYS